MAWWSTSAAMCLRSSMRIARLVDRGLVDVPSKSRLSKSISSRQSKDKSASISRSGFRRGRRSNRYSNCPWQRIATTTPHQVGISGRALSTSDSSTKRTIRSKHLEYARAWCGSRVTLSFGPLISTPISKSAMMAKSTRARPRQTSISSTSRARERLRTSRGTSDLTRSRRNCSVTSTWAAPEAGTASRGVEEQGLVVSMAERARTVQAILCYYIPGLMVGHG